MLTSLTATLHCNIKNRCASSNYFQSNSVQSAAKMNEVIVRASSLPEPQRFGEFIDNQHYLDAVDLLILSTLETEHRNEILAREILPKLKSFNNMLDIGIGNGDLTRDLSYHYNNLTVVDTHIDALANIEDYHPKTSQKIEKIHGSIEEVDLSGRKYDLIVLSHLLYYIEPTFRISLIKKLYNLLDHNGSILIIFNEGLSRYELTKFFGGTSFEFSDFINEVDELYKSIEIIESKEEIKTTDLNAMLQIAGVCIKDASAYADREDLVEYLQANHYNGENYYIDMVQKLVIIGELNIE